MLEDVLDLGPGQPEVDGHQDPSPPGTPKNDVSSLAELCDTMATRSPGPMPRRSRPAAWARARSASRAKVIGPQGSAGWVGSSMTATRSGIGALGPVEELADVELDLHGISPDSAEIHQSRHSGRTRRGWFLRRTGSGRRPSLRCPHDPAPRGRRPVPVRVRHRCRTRRRGRGRRADRRPDSLVWLDPGDVEGLTAWLAEVPDARWVQLPFAGVERVAAAGLLDDARIWTCAKGAYAEPVAEHALALALAGLRHLPTRVEARSWGIPAGTSLYDQQGDHRGRRRDRHVPAGAARPVPGGGHRGATEPGPGGRRGPGAVRRPAVRGAGRPAGGRARPLPHPGDDRDHRRRRAGGHAGDGVAGQRGPGPPRGHRRPGGGPRDRDRSPARRWT